MATLAQQFADDFRVGCVIDGDLPTRYTDAERQLIVEQFNAITIENSLKAHRVHPEPERYEFAVPDAICDFAERHRMEMTGHCLLWHQSYPEWFFEGGGRADILRRLDGHIRTVLGQYRGRMRGWDVVNEAVSDKADEWLRPSSFTRTIGEDFVVRAFEMAHAADPTLELYYNDYSIELPAKREKTLKLLRQLQSAGCRIDAVGIQGHFVGGKVPMRELEESILAYAALGLKVMITELDIDVYDRHGGADVAATQAGTGDMAVCPPDKLRRQADEYAAVFETLRRHRDHVTRVTFWGLHDGHSWLNNWPVKGRTNHALLFDRQCRPKPAWDAVMGR